MLCRGISWFTCFSVAVVIAVNYSDPGSTTVSDPDVTVYRLRTESPESTTGEPYQVAKQTAAVDLPDLLDAGEGAIVTLVAGSTRLVAHKAVLATRSPVFAAIFGHDTLEASGGQVTVTDVEGPVLRHLVAYLYTLQAPQLPSMALQLLVAADRYGVLGLKAHCEQQVEAQLSVETAAAIAVLAVRHSDRLKQAAVSFIKAHFFHIVSTQGWADMRRSHPQDLLEVIQLLSDPSAVTSAPPPATADSSGPSPSPTPATQPHSTHSDDTVQTAASATPPTAACHTATPDDAAVSRLRSLPAEEKDRRLIEAAQKGAVEDLQLLLAAGADVGARDEYLGTALNWAARKGHLEAARCLLGNGAEVDARNDRQSTPLMSAAESGHSAVVRLLLASSADPNARNKFPATPLHYAAAHGNADSVTALLEAGAEVDARNLVQSTPLHDAASGGHTAAVRLLLASSAYHSARNKYGKTPLHYAAENGHRETAAALLEAGADRAARNNEGHTPLDLAKQKNHQQLVDALS